MRQKPHWIALGKILQQEYLALLFNSHSLNICYCHANHKSSLRDRLH